MAKPWASSSDPSSISPSSATNAACSPGVSVSASASSFLPSDAASAAVYAAICPCVIVCLLKERTSRLLPPYDATNHAHRRHRMSLSFVIGACSTRMARLRGVARGNRHHAAIDAPSSPQPPRLLVTQRDRRYDGAPGGLAPL